MGLTIHYGLSTHENRTASEVEDILSKLCEEAHQMRREGLLTFVSNLRHFDSAEIQAEQGNHGSKWLWAVIQSGLQVIYQSKFITVDAIEGYLFRTWFGSGCEEANFGLMRYPAMIDVSVEGSDTKEHIATGRTTWHWHSFCKTTYAVQPVQAHLSVVALLDKAKELGLDIEVNDEGGYWEHRDVVTLARKFTSDATMLSAFAAILSKEYSDVQAPIMERGDYPDLAEKGLTAWRATTGQTTIDVLRALSKAQGKAIE